MTKRKALVLILLLACIGIAGLVVTTTRNKEPSYQGRTLSQWLDSRSPMQDATRVYAIRQIGTNALPLLLKRIQPPSPLETKIYHWLIRLHLNSTEDGELSRHEEEALAGFAALGEEARPAIPALVAMIDTNNFNPTCSAEALGDIGKDALPALIDLVTNSLAHTNTDRQIVAMAFQQLKTNAFLAKPALLAHIRDPNPQVACAVTTALAMLGVLQDDMTLPPDSVADIVPAFCANLDTTNTQLLLWTARALFYFRSNALPAVPALLHNLTSTNLQIHAAAAAALDRIDPEALARAQKQ